MKSLNVYIIEAWSGIKKHTNNAEIEAWCEKMRIQKYTINSQGEIDVNGDGGVWLNNKDFEELPYKFGTINGYFSLSECKNLTSLKNCPDYVGGFFSCNSCQNLDSLEGCPKRVMFEFICNDCKRKFTEKEVQKYCNVKKHDIII